MCVNYGKIFVFLMIAFRMSRWRPKMYPVMDYIESTTKSCMKAFIDYFHNMFSVHDHQIRGKVSDLGLNTFKCIYPRTEYKLKLPNNIAQREYRQSADFQSENLLKRVKLKIIHLTRNILVNF